MISVLHRARVNTSMLSRDQSGSAAIEYAIIGAAVGLGIVAALFSTKRAQNLNLDKISYSMSQAMDKIQLPKTVGSEVQLASYTDNGKVINQKRVNYTDGTFDLIRTPADPGCFTISIQNFDKNNREVTSTFIDGAGKTTLAETTYLNDTTVVSKKTGDGSCNCSIRNTTRVCRRLMDRRSLFPTATSSSGRTQRLERFSNISAFTRRHQILSTILGPWSLRPTEPFHAMETWQNTFRNFDADLKSVPKYRTVAGTNRLHQTGGRSSWTAPVRLGRSDHPSRRPSTLVHRTKV